MGYETFGIHDFFGSNHLVIQNLAFSYQFLKFKIWIIQTLSHGLMT